MRKLLGLLLGLALAIPASADVVSTSVGRTFGSGGGGGVTTGTTTDSSGATYCLVRLDATSTYQCTSWLTADDSGVGTPTITFTKTPSGASATSNFLNITGTQPDTTSPIHGVLFDIDTQGSSNQIHSALKVVLGAGWNAQNSSYAGIFENQTANLGTAANIGIWGNSAGAATVRLGGYFSLFPSGTTPTAVGHTSAALTANNGLTTDSIFHARDNGTSVFSVLDGGVSVFGNTATTANAISIQETAGQITFEGATSDTIQTRLVVTDPTASDKTITFPNLTGTVALMGVPQTGPLIFDAAINKNSGICGGTSCSTSYASFVTANTTLTPDSGSISSGTLSESVHFVSSPDTNYDFNNGPCGTSACANPTLIGHSANQDTQEYWALSHDGTAGVLQAANSTRKSGEIKFGRTVALTEAGGAETVITITTATTQSFGLELSYQVRASDATPDYAVREGSLKLVCVNNATAVTCTKDATTQADDESVLINTNSKTLTYAIASDVATANVAKITFDIDSDMTVTAAEITFTAVLNGSGTIS